MLHVGSILNVGVPSLGPPYNLLVVEKIRVITLKRAATGNFPTKSNGVIMEITLGACQ